MKRFALPLLTLLLSSAALAACPAHPGYILNGRAAQPAGLQVICGEAFAAYKRAFGNDPNVKWTEMYGVKNNTDATNLARKMNVIFSNLGYVLVQNKEPSPTSRTFGYLNVTNQKLIVMYMAVSGPLVLVSFSGN